MYFPGARPLQRPALSHATGAAASVVFTFETPMKKTAILATLLLAAGTAQAEEGLSLGIGVDYSTGDYGTGVDTRILSVPLTASYGVGQWTFKASVPWMRVEGDPTVLPGLGTVTNPTGRGRIDTGTGTVSETSSASGLGDVRLAATYSIPTSDAGGIDLTANAKLATADEDKGLGTGGTDFGVAADAYRTVGSTTFFGGVGYTWLGESVYIDVDAAANANAGLAFDTSGGSRVGVVYEWREAITTLTDARSEVTGFVTMPAGEKNKFQLYATKGFSDGSPDWGAGVAYTAAF